MLTISNRVIQVGGFDVLFGLVMLCLHRILREGYNLKLKEQEFCWVLQLSDPVEIYRI